MYRIGIIAIALLFVGAFGLNGKHSKKGRHVKVYHRTAGVDISRYTTNDQIVGIDVSMHTGIINWDIIKRQGVDFAYIKSTEGADYLDPRYLYNLREAKSAGLPVGAYHFFRFHRTGKEQAANFLSQVDVRSLDLPPVVDVEEWGQYNFSKNAGYVSAEVQSFINNIENKTNRRVVIYADKNSFKKYIEGKFRNNPIWICSIGKAPQISQKWTLWQKSQRGKCSGASGIVDINLFNGDNRDWKEFLQN
ncbi:MAG: glycoside hydrolase family 25 [Bacteroidetes bacterium]|nr:glycoside hydrolase family 25 [Bacteroidota bacterium]